MASKVATCLDKPPLPRSIHASVACLGKFCLTRADEQAIRLRDTVGLIVFGSRVSHDVQTIKQTILVLREGPVRVLDSGQDVEDMVFGMFGEGGSILFTV